MSKPIAEQTNSLSIFWLKKYGYLPQKDGVRCGGIKWRYGLSGAESSISFIVTTNLHNTLSRKQGVQLKYTHTDRWTGETREMNYRVPLTTTPCNYGGVRYWFRCPLSKNDVHCGRRVGVLYSVSKYFGCRHCADVAYQTQMYGGKFRPSSVTEPDIRRLEEDIKTYYYNGKPTRKYGRLMEMRRKLDRDMAIAIGMLEK